jgi:Rod binding domain-containing protein
MKIVPRQVALTGPEAPESSLKVATNPSAAPAKDEQVAEDFEALFFDMMLQSMRKTAVSEDQSNAMGIYTGMLDSEYSKSIASSSSFGIKKLILDWLRRHERNPAQADVVGSVGGTQVNTPSPPQARSATLNDVDVIAPGKLGSRLATELYSLQARMLSK